MDRRVAAALVWLGTVGCPATSTAQGDPPDAARVRQAADSYDAGVQAWRAGRYAAAASHFEAADEAVPSAVSLAEAIKSRRKAGHGARAATLGALARQRHPEDEALDELAREVIKEFGPANHRLEVRCSARCVLAVGSRVIAGPATQRAVIYVEPGRHMVSASFEDGDGAAQHWIVAQAGGKNTLYLRPEPTGDDPSSARGASPAPPDESAASAAPPAADAVGSASPGARPPTPAPEPARDATPAAGDGWPGLSPVWFFVGLGATAVIGGVTIWSGVDTMEDPGQEEVRTSCVGLGVDCPAYQEGLDKQVRTNALIGVTASAAAVTAALGLLLTDWSGGEQPAAGTVGARLKWCFGPGTLGVNASF